MEKEKRLNTTLPLSAEAKPRILFERSGCGNEPLSSPVRFDYKLAKLRRVPEKNTRSVKNNTALTSNPRVREEHPGLIRPNAARKSGESVQLARVRQNKALANSPRMREQFPELRFESSPPENNPALKVAPATSTGGSDSAIRNTGTYEFLRHRCKPEQAVI